MGARDLDVVAKDAGVADLEGRDAGGVSFFGFKSCDGDAGIGGYGAQVFEFLGEALADDAACGEGRAGFIGDGITEKIAYVVVGFDGFERPRERAEGVAVSLDLGGVPPRSRLRRWP